MKEEQILSAIANYCQNDQLIFQVIVRDTQAHIYVNRQGEDDIDYFQLKDSIVAAISDLQNSNLEQISLYSRILGQTEPDWQTAIDLKPTNTGEATDCLEENAPLEPSNIHIANSEDSYSLIDKHEPENETPNESDTSPENEDSTETLDFSSYCFIRNKRLLSGEIVLPKPNIARLIEAFHELENSTQEEQLPILSDYFQNFGNPDTEKLQPEIQSWWHEILELSPEESRKAAIWLSRYCLNPKETLLTLESVFTAEKAIAESRSKTIEEKTENMNSQTESELRSPTEYAYISQQQSDRDSQSNAKNTNINTIQKSKVASTVNKPFKIKLLLPIIWFAVTLSFIIFDLNQPTNALPVACENLVSENLDYCLLANEMVGKEPLNAVVNNLPEPLKEEESLVPEAMMSNGSFNCELHGNIAAGVPLKEATPFKTPVLSTYTKEIVPDFYVADVEQTNLKEGNPTVRTVCFFYRVEKIGKPYSIKFLAFDQVDLNYPEVAYEPTKKIKSVQALNNTSRTYNFFSLLGINTLFTAIAIYLVAICGMAIKVNSIETIYQASFVLGMTKSILSFLPLLGIFIIVPLECIALGITSGCVREFKIDWNSGYSFVAATAMLLIALRMLLTFLFLGFLSAVFA